jgi:type I restriction enzyme, S subunit
MTSSEASPAPPTDLYRPLLPRHWDRVPLYSLATWVNGLAFRNTSFSETGIPVIKIAEIKGGISGQTKYTKEVFDDSVRVTAGDLLFSWSGQPETSIDAFWWRGPDGWLNQHVFRVTPGVGVDAAFLYYLLRYLNRNFVAIARNKQTTGLGHVTKRDLQRIEAARPKPNEQRAIASVLGALDDKIEQNRRTARVLERLARAIFRAWFVDFEPVKAKAAGAISFPSMPQQVFDALPTSFVESEIGPVPEGWKVKVIGDVVTLKGGGTPSTKTPEYWAGGEHCWATPKDMSRLSHPVLLDTERRITDAGVDRISSGLLPAGSVLMSSRAPVGYLAIAGVATAINQGFIAMVCDETLPPVYVLNWAFASMDTIKAHASGTTFAEISKKNFRPLPIVEPASEVIRTYQYVAEPLFELLTACVREDERLARLRDYLLPQLLSGQVRVKV